MRWAGFLTQYRAGLAALGAAGAHGAALVAILAYVPADDLPEAPPPIPVELVALQPPPQPITPPPEPQPDIIPPAKTASAPLPDLRPSSPPPVAAPAPETVPFTSLGNTTNPEERVVPPPPAGTSGPVERGGLASEAARGVQAALRRAGCRKLVREPGPECPQGDLFARADELAALKQAAALEPLALGPPPSQNYAEAFFARNQGMPAKMINGEDNSIFIASMAPGAYNAQRIRNGQAPIWDRKTREALERR